MFFLYSFCFSIWFFWLCLKSVTVSITSFVTFHVYKNAFEELKNQAVVLIDHLWLAGLQCWISGWTGAISRIMHSDWFDGYFLVKRLKKCMICFWFCVLIWMISTCKYLFWLENNELISCKWLFIIVRPNLNHFF